MPPLTIIRASCRERVDAETRLTLSSALLVERLRHIGHAIERRAATADVGDYQPHHGTNLAAGEHAYAGGN